MKKVPYSLIGLFLLSLGIYSCTKESIDTKKDYQRKSITNITMPKLSDENFNYIGENHNKILHDFAKRNENRFPSIDEFIEYEHASLSTYFQLTSKEERVEIANQIMESRTLANSQINSYYTEMCQKIDESENVAQINEKMDIIIQQVKSNQELTNLEYNASISMLTVAKKSAYFWMPKNIGGSGVGETLIRHQLDEGEIPPYGRILRADAFGAADGILVWCAHSGYRYFTGGPALGIGSIITYGLGGALH